ANNKEIKEFKKNLKIIEARPNNEGLVQPFTPITPVFPGREPTVIGDDTLEGELKIENYPNLETISLFRTGGITKLTIENCPKLEVLNVAGSKIKQIIGLENCPKLKILNICANEIAEVDVSKNVALQALVVGNNNHQTKIRGLEKLPDLLLYNGEGGENGTNLPLLPQLGAAYSGVKDDDEKVHYLVRLSHSIKRAIDNLKTLEINVDEAEIDEKEPTGRKVDEHGEKHKGHKTRLKEFIDPDLYGLLNIYELYGDELNENRRNKNLAGILSTIGLMEDNFPKFSEEEITMKEKDVVEGQRRAALLKKLRDKLKKDLEIDIYQADGEQSLEILAEEETAETDSNEPKTIAGYKSQLAQMSNSTLRSLIAEQKEGKELGDIEKRGLEVMLILANDDFPENIEGPQETLAENKRRAEVLTQARNKLKNDLDQVAKLLGRKETREGELLKQEPDNIFTFADAKTEKGEQLGLSELIVVHLSIKKFVEINSNLLKIIGYNLPTEEVNGEKETPDFELKPDPFADPNDLINDSEAAAEYERKLKILLADNGKEPDSVKAGVVVEGEEEIQKKTIGDDLEEAKTYALNNLNRLRGITINDKGPNDNTLATPKQLIEYFDIVNEAIKNVEKRLDLSYAKTAIESPYLLLEKLFNTNDTDLSKEISRLDPNILADGVHWEDGIENKISIDGLKTFSVYSSDAICDLAKKRALNDLTELKSNLKDEEVNAAVNKARPGTIPE
ncbi:15673_t:CDS:2, partial [Cetraspora pellucida]